MPRRLVTPLLVALPFVLVTLAAPASAPATPFHAVNAARACATCHAEPVGWHNPPNVMDRRCSLSCSACHVSPSGGGLRTPTGTFYGREELPTWGRRPSEFADPLRFARPGEPTEGRYSLFDGFSGWWGGDVPHRTVEDRLGNIDPDPVWSGGFDARTMAVIPTTQTDVRDVAVFPMELQGYLAVRPVDKLVAYLDLGIQGSQDRYEDSGFSALEQIWARELFVMVDDLPGASYVRAGRFAPAYGWRVPDHTAYIREALNFDQFRQGYGVEVGTAPNEWWGNLGAYYQGFDDWPGEEGLPTGYGVTGQGGYKGLGYQLGATGHAFFGDDGYRELAGGGMWALNLDPVAYVGEVDVQHVDQGGALVPASGTSVLDASRTGFVAYHEVQLYRLVPGLRPRLRYEWLDPDITIADDHLHRVVVGAEWFPIAQVSVDLAYRTELSPLSESKGEVLGQVHAMW